MFCYFVSYNLIIFVLMLFDKDLQFVTLHHYIFVCFSVFRQSLNVGVFQHQTAESLLNKKQIKYTTTLTLNDCAKFQDIKRTVKDSPVL